MNDRRIRGRQWLVGFVVFSFTLLALMTVAILRGWPLITAVIGSFTVLVVALLSEHWVYITDNRLVRATLIGIGIGLSFIVLYRLLTPGKSWRHALLFGLQMSVLAAVFCYRQAQRIISRREKQASAKRHVGSNVRNNFLGDRLDSFMHLLAENEDEIEFAAALPVIQGVINLAIPVQLMAFSYWASTRFSGLSTWIHSVQSGSPPIVGLTVLILALLVILTIENLWDRSLSSRQLLVRLLGTVAFCGWWYANGAPLSTWLINSIQDDYWRLWLVIALPATAWVLLVIEAFVRSAQLVTNTTFKICTDSRLLEGNSVSKMNRSAMTNATFKQGLFRALMGYWLGKQEGKGQDDAEFHRVRTRHGDVLELVLTG